jgi:thiol-disulfide isomerase/thioredoxin
MNATLSTKAVVPCAGTSNHRTATTRSFVLQRKCACGGSTSFAGECEECRKGGQFLHRRVIGAAPDVAPPIVHEVLRSPGKPLDVATRAVMEPRFDRDFSQVRVHTDAKAAESAHLVNALAYTVGNHVVFGGRQFAPHSPAGRRLLAHELSHASQHSSDIHSAGYIAIGSANGPEEAAAVAAETIAEEGQVAVVSSGLSAPTVLRRKPQDAAAAADAPEAPPAVASCLHPVSGEEIESLLESGAVTVVEYGAEWCKPCKALQADLGEICQKFRAAPTPVTIRFYSVDVDDPLNEETRKRQAPGAIPQLSIYVGSTRRYHTSGRPEFEIVEERINEQIEYASRSGAARGARTGLKWGAGIGGGLGLALGIGLALGGVLSGPAGILAVLGLAAGGALVGGALGAGTGAVAGALTDERKRAASARVGFNEAETLIRRRYGRYLDVSAGPLHNARIRPVTQTQLQTWNKCRHPEQSQDYLNRLVGWTDTGPPPNRIEPSKAEAPKEASECNKLEDATLQRPVIYYARDRRDLTVLIHEGLHAYAHPNFTAQVRNYVNEGAAEYLAGQLTDEIGALSQSDYGENVQRIRNLVSVIGEEALRIAYFKGDFSGADRILGPCGMERWAQLLTANRGESVAAEEILKSRNRNYCDEVRVFPTGLKG